MLNALNAAATRVTRSDYPYVYGGGHAMAGVASIGIPGPGYNGHRIGFDCSGSVAAVLAAGGLWPAGSGVPSEAGMISQLLGENLIAPGVGMGPVEVTLYDDPGVHIFMNIDGRFFGTWDGGGSGDSKGGAGWLNDGAPLASSSAYKRYHVLPSVLNASTRSGQSITFQTGQLEGLQSGEQVRVSFEEVSSGSMIAIAIGYPGAIKARGTVTSIADDGSSFTITTARGESLTFSTGHPSGLIGGIVVGEAVTVTYTRNASAATARVVAVAPTPGAAVRSTSHGAGAPDE